MNKFMSKFGLVISTSLSLVLLPLLSFAILFSDAKISDHDNEILQEQNLANNMLLRTMDADSHSETANLFGTLGVIHKVTESDVAPGADANPEVIQIRKKLKEGLITSHEYYSELFQFYNRTEEFFNEKYNTHTVKVNQMLKSGTPWETTKTVLFFFSILFTLTLGAINLYLLRESMAQ